MKSAFCSVPDNQLSIAVNAQEQTVAIVVYGNPHYYRVISPQAQFTDNELYVVAVWFATKTFDFLPTEWITVTVPKLITQYMVNRAKTQNTLLRRLIREAALIQATKDFVIRALYSPDVSPHAKTLNTASQFKAIIVCN